MLMNNPGPAIFEADPDDEYRLSFVIKNTILADGPKTLMTMRYFEEDKMRSAIVWFGERQHLWPEWMEFAERHDGETLENHLVHLITMDSLYRFGSTEYMSELCCGATLECVGQAEVELSLTLATRKLNIITHAFATEDQRNACMSSIFEDNRSVGPVELAELALLRGRDALRRVFDEIACTGFGLNSGTVH